MGVARQVAGQGCVCATLRKAARSVTQIYDQTLRPSSLRATQFHLLMHVRGAGEATVTALAKRLGTDQSTLTRNVALLERKGMLQSIAKPDARLKALRLTGKGAKALEIAVPLWTAAQARVLNEIGRAGWATLSDELERIVTALHG